MRFAALNLLRYGHFDNCALTFAARPIDLHVVFGQNEAGKSTTMAAINDLLFGFPHITPYDYRVDRQLLRVGAVIEDDAKSLACRRKKGRAGTLLDDDEHPIDEGSIAAMLHGYSTESFQRMFSLDHARLRDGGRAILKAENDIGQAIFAAGSGLVGVADLLARLEDEAKQIWTKRAGDRLYYHAKHRADEARARLRAATFRPAAWKELKQRLEQLDEKLAASRLALKAIGREREIVDRQRRTLPHVAAHNRAAAELDTLESVILLPADAAATLAAAERDLSTADIEARLAVEDHTRLTETLAKIEINPSLMAHASKIEALREEKGAIEKAALDLPRRRAEHKTSLDHLRTLQRELGWTGDATATLARMPGRTRLAEIRGLLQRHGALEASLNGAITDARNASAEYDRLDRVLNDLPTPDETAALSAALKAGRALGDTSALCETATAELQRRNASLEAALSRLLPWQGDIAALRRIDLPDEVEAAEAASLAARLETDFAAAERACQDASNRREVLVLRRTQLLTGGGAIPPASVSEARARRDERWSGIREHLTGAAILAQPADAATGFALALQSADDLADRRYDAAEKSGRLVNLLHEIEEADLLAEQLVRRRDAAATARINAAEAWRERLAPTGVIIPAKDYAAWHGRRAAALQADEDAKRARMALDKITASADAALRRVTAELSALGKGVDGTLAGALAAAEQVEALALRQANDRREAASAIDRALASLRDAEARKQAGLRAIAEWQAKWESALVGAGLDPATSHTVVQAQLEVMEDVRATAHELVLLEQRIGSMDADARAFARAVSDLAAECAMDVADEAAELLVVRIADAARAAATSQTQHNSTAEELRKASNRIDAARRARLVAEGRLKPLMDEARAVDRDDLLRKIAASDRVRALRQEKSDYAKAVVEAGGGLAFETLIEEAGQADAAALPVRATELQALDEARNAEIVELTGHRVSLDAEFRKLDEGPEAALAAADFELARAEMVQHAETYVRKRTEAALLRRTIANYRLSRQAPLLRRASALFQTLTLGRYEELLVDHDAETARLTGRAPDDTIKSVEAMSEGTVDQLFLALRLAAVEEAVNGGARLPFLADDLFVNYDDDRAAAGFKVLGELARSTQVLFFTHHQHLITVAEEALGDGVISRCSLG